MWLEVRGFIVCFLPVSKTGERLYCSTKGEKILLVGWEGAVFPLHQSLSNYTLGMPWVILKMNGVNNYIALEVIFF